MKKIDHYIYQYDVIKQCVYEYSFFISMYALTRDTICNKQKTCTIKVHI